MRVLRCEIDCALLNGDTDGEGSLAVDFGLIVRKVLVKELMEKLRRRQDCSYEHRSLTERFFSSDILLAYAMQGYKRNDVHRI